MQLKRYISLCLLVFGFNLLQPQTTATVGSVEFENSKKYIYQPETRLKLLQTAVAKGNANAMVDLGVLYYNGYDNFLKVNFEEAIKLWKAAEVKEHPIAMFNLGICNLNGKGVEKNVENAITYFKKSAELQYVKAMVELGDLYFNKKVIPRNVQNAHIWYQKAVENGFTKLIPKMLTAEKMVEAEKVLQNPNASDFEKGVAYFELENGKEAIIWLEKAAEKGNDKAMTVLGLAIEKCGMQFNK
ncbi:MAG: tetratricopeptide repeat protein [Flavobacterium sp.]